MLETVLAVTFSFSGFHLQTNKSFDVFLLEKGSQLFLIMQEFIRPQPFLTVTHDTQISMSMSIKKISDARCQKISASEQISCSLDKVQNKIKKKHFACLPFQYRTVFPKLYLEYPQCKKGLASSINSFHVR